MQILAQVAALDWNPWLFGALCYLAAGSWFVSRAKGASKYYYRKYKSDKQPVVVVSALFVCVVFWPLLLARKDVDL
jgi:hypothetical protein